MIQLLIKFLKNINVLSNGDTTSLYFYLFNNAVLSTTQKDFYKNRLYWRIEKNDKKNVNRCNPFRTDQSCYNRK